MYFDTRGYQLLSAYLCKARILGKMYDSIAVGRYCNLEMKAPEGLNHSPGP